MSRLALFLFTRPLLAQMVPPAAADPTPDPLRDIAPPVPPTFWESLDAVDGLLLAAALAFTITAIWFAWRWLRRRRPAPPPPDPREVSLARLRALRDQAGTLPPRDFGAEASGVLREFLRARHGLPAPQRTSEEFLAALSINPLFAERQRELLARFLTQCDRLKFADVREDIAAEATRLVEDAEHFVNEPAASPATAPTNGPSSPSPPVIRPEILGRAASPLREEAAIGSVPVRSDK